MTPLVRERVRGTYGPPRGHLHTHQHAVEQPVTALRGVTALLTTLRQRPLIRFVIVGAFVTVIDFSVFNLIIRLAGAPSAMHALVANTISFTVASNVGYQLHARITFRSVRHWRGFTAFGAVAVMGVLISDAALQALLLLFHLLSLFETNSPLALNAAKAGAVLVAAIWNYQGYRIFAFGGHARGRQQADVTA